MAPYAAIDPLALLLTNRAYLILTELRHPHEPIIATLRNVMAKLPVEERRAVAINAKHMAEHVNAVLELAG